MNIQDETPVNSKQEKNGKLLIIILGILAAVIVLFSANAYNKADEPAVNNSTAPVQNSSATASSDSSASVTPESTALSQQTVTSANPSTEEILKAVSDAINSLKDPSASFTGVKTQDISVELTTCSVPTLTGVANKVIELFTGEETYTFDFTNGTAIDPEEKEEISSNEAIPPTDKPFTLTKEGVASAKSEKDGENTVYTIIVVAEKSTLADPRPPHHNAAGDTFDLSDIDLPIGEINKADFEYPGATVSVTVDKNGRVIKYHERLEMKGIGEGGALGLTASGEMVGYIDETWDIQWK